MGNSRHLSRSARSLFLGVCLGGVAHNPFSTSKTVAIRAPSTPPPQASYSDGTKCGTLHYGRRGLRDEYQRIACDWWLCRPTQLPGDPVEIARQQNWGKDALAKATTLANQEQQATNDHEDGRPAALDTAYNHNMGIRKGRMR